MHAANWQTTGWVYEMIHFNSNRNKRNKQRTEEKEGFFLPVVQHGRFLPSHPGVQASPVHTQVWAIKVTALSAPGEGDENSDRLLYL